MPSQNILALTGLRFFAAMLIVLWHSQTGYFFEYGAFQPFFLFGAVPLFFVLSGFVLTLGADRYHSWPDFFVARVARVWPGHIAALVFLFWIFYPSSIDLLCHIQTIGQLVLNVLLLQSWFPQRAIYWSYNAPSWSVSCELFYYAMFPVIFIALQRQTLVRAGLIGVFVLLAILAIARAYPDIDPNWLGNDNPISGLMAFVTGVAAGIWRRRLRHPRPGTGWTAPNNTDAGANSWSNRLSLDAK